MEQYSCETDDRKKWKFLYPRISRMLRTIKFFSKNMFESLFRYPCEMHEQFCVCLAIVCNLHRIERIFFAQYKMIAHKICLHGIFENINQIVDQLNQFIRDPSCQQIKIQQTASVHLLCNNNRQIRICRWYICTYHNRNINNRRKPKLKRHEIFKIQYVIWHVHCMESKFCLSDKCGQINFRTNGPDFNSYEKLFQRFILLKRDLYCWREHLLFERDRVRTHFLIEWSVPQTVKSFADGVRSVFYFLNNTVRLPNQWNRSAGTR